MTLRVTVEHSQVDALLAELARPSAFLSHIGEVIKAQTEARFTTKQSPTGGTWSPWSTGYAKTRKGVDSLLIDVSTHKSGTPHLKDSIQVEYGDHQLEVGSNVPYATTHQRGKGKIRKRPFLGIGPQDHPDILRAIGSAFQEMVARVGGSK